MEEEHFFSLTPYHFALVGVGFIVILAHWAPRLISAREPVAAPLMILLGALGGLYIPNILTLPDPREVPLPWELVSELTVIVALFGAGMRIDKLQPWRRWSPTFRMLAIAMPLTIFAVGIPILLSLIHI